MRIKLKATRIPGGEPVVFKNPNGEPVCLKKVGDVSEEISPELAHALCTKYSDILEIASGDYAQKMAVVSENKTLSARPGKARLKGEEAPLAPPEIN